VEEKSKRVEEKSKRVEEKSERVRENGREGVRECKRMEERENTFAEPLRGLHFI